MNKTNKIVAVLIIIVILIFGVLFFTMPHNSDQDLVGGLVEESVEELDIETVGLFMIKIENFKYIEDFDYCLFVSTSIFFKETDVVFDYVRTVCYYGDYIIFDTPGAMYITNDKYTKLVGVMIDDIAGLGGELG